MNAKRLIALMALLVTIALVMEWLDQQDEKRLDESLAKHIDKHVQATVTDDESLDFDDYLSGEK